MNTQHQPQQQQQQPQLNAIDNSSGVQTAEQRISPASTILIGNNCADSNLSQANFYVAPAAAANNNVANQYFIQSSNQMAIKQPLQQQQFQQFNNQNNELTQQFQQQQQLANNLKYYTTNSPLAQGKLLITYNKLTLFRRNVYILHQIDIYSYYKTNS